MIQHQHEHDFKERVDGFLRRSHKSRADNFASSFKQ